MPKREDEYWAGQKDNLKYCSKHQRYYDAKIGCQLCFLEEQNLKRRVDEIPQLQKCPVCNRESLFWNKDFGLFECLNLQCKRKFAQDEISQEAAETMESGEVDKEQKNQDLRESESPDAGGIEQPDKQHQEQDKVRGAELTDEKLGKQEGNKNVSEHELKKEGKQGLCPFCASPNIYEVVKDSWRCRKCEKTFASPSYGPPGGRSMCYPASREQEVRTQEPPSSGRAWFGKEYFDPKGRRWRKPKRAFPIKMDEMLRLTAKLLLVCAGIFGIVLGSHGLYIYFSGLEKAELLLGFRDPSKLFMALSVPSWFGSVVSWATFRGIWSWFIPAAIVAGGVFLFYLQGKIYARMHVKFILAFVVIAAIVASAVIYIPKLSSGNRIASGPISVTSLVGGYDPWELRNPYLHYYIGATLSSTSLTQPGKDYTVFLVENPLIGNRLNLGSQVVSWSQREMDLKTTKTVYWYIPDDKAALYNLDFYESNWGLLFTKEEQAYSDKVQKTIGDHFTLSWR